MYLLGIRKSLSFFPSMSPQIFVKLHCYVGHSAWVSSSVARQEVFRLRASSNAVIVGGQTVRRDNPRLTTRRDRGHTPVRIVMSRTLDLPEVLN